ncbi:hypothetical protein TIFTF001_012365 [Ficus carica]|uniref:Uncharacterized protein n=1 Tax=Ficus carica TaxID=3494 RepID=A0AA87ZZV5_FICCA|nr:hypothetical protein TIFTF001_012365 [Ficus carica]
MEQQPYRLNRNHVDVQDLVTILVAALQVQVLLELLKAMQCLPWLEDPPCTDLLQEWSSGALVHVY